MQPLTHRMLPLLAACACMLSGCLGGGIYSVQHNDYAQYDQFPSDVQPESMACDGGCCGGISLLHALAATCGPPELCHDECFHADPGATVSPTPKYHPLPTRPVFQPLYPLPMESNEQAAVNGMLPRTGDKSASSTRWRGSLPRFNDWHVPSQPKARVAYDPLHDVTFPRFPAAYQEPPVLNPANANPIRSKPTQQR